MVEETPKEEATQGVPFEMEEEVYYDAAKD